MILVAKSSKESEDSIQELIENSSRESSADSFESAMANGGIDASYE